MNEWVDCPRGEEDSEDPAQLAYALIVLSNHRDVQCVDGRQSFASEIVHCGIDRWAVQLLDIDLLRVCETGQYRKAHQWDV